MKLKWYRFEEDYEYSYPVTSLAVWVFMDRTYDKVVIAYYDTVTKEFFRVGKLHPYERKLDKREIIAWAMVRCPQVPTKNVIITRKREDFEQ